MKQLTELKDNQKVLIALTVKKNYKNPYPNELYGNDKEDYFSALTTDLKEVERLEPEELYDFDEVMNAKKSEPIVKHEFDAIIEDYLHQLHTDCIEEKQFLQKMYNLFQSYHPESFTPEIGKEYFFYNKDDKKKYKGIFRGYEASVLGQFDVFKFIEPIQQSEEELKAIEMLKNLGYKIEK